MKTKSKRERKKAEISSICWFAHRFTTARAGKGEARSLEFIPDLS